LIEYASPLVELGVELIGRQAIVTRFDGRSIGAMNEALAAELVVFD